jgi:nucleotide-binding universal stress UspA family protein
MARYLLVAHQTAASPALLSKVRELIAGDPQSEFGLLVPATPVPHLLTWAEGEAVEVAREAAEVARAELERTGASVSRAVVGDASPLLAIADELRERPDGYDAIVISTLPIGASRWLGLDLPHQAERKFALPVIHVVSEEKER